MIGTTISHYEITAELGRGGMGVVYKARDTRLNRDVALKFLVDHLIPDEKSHDRFMQEARAAAALNHANICTLHDVGEEDGKLFLVMEFVEGRSLKEIIDSGELDETTATDYALQIATGLERAHEAGIVHRDIKPANIMITPRNEAKIMDFGLAKLSGGLDLTKTGSTVGTALYMSPEQARGEVLDSASDVWSLGVVLYEMLVGERPFKGQYDAALIYGILNVEPDFAHERVNPIVGHLRSMLAKDAANRPAAGDVASALSVKASPSSEATTPTAGSATIRWKTLAAAVSVLVVGSFGYQFLSSERSSEPTEKTGIAVIPCEDLSPVESGGGLGIGLAHVISEDLRYYSQLKIPESTATGYFRDNSATAVEIGEALGVDYVVNCWITRDLDQIIVRAELTETNSGELLWGESFEDQFDRVLALQRRMRDQIIGKMRIPLLRRLRDGDADEVDPRAYDYYLRAFEYDNLEGWPTLIRYMDLALSKDSTFLRAHFRKASTILNMAGFGAMDLESASTIFNHHVNKILSLDPDFSRIFTLLSLGQLMIDNDWDAALQTASLALEKGDPYPGHVIDMLTGNLSQARSDIMEYARLNASSSGLSLGNAHYLMRAGYLAETEIILSRAEKYHAEEPLFGLRRGELALMKEEYQQALVIFNAMVEAGAGNDPFVRTYQGIAAAAVGDMNLVREALSVIERLDASLPTPRFHMSRAFMKASLGEIEESIELLEEGVEVNAIWAYCFWYYIPLPEVRSHPRFIKIMKETMPGDAWSYAKFSRGGGLLNPEEVEANALDWRTLYGQTDK